jgi:hypothetical protein
MSCGLPIRPPKTICFSPCRLLSSTRAPSTRASGGCSGRSPRRRCDDSTRMGPAMWGLLGALCFSTATSVTPNHPPYRYFHLLCTSILVPVPSTFWHCTATSQRALGRTTDSTRTHIDPCTTHVSRSNTEQLLEGGGARFSNIGLIRACMCLLLLRGPNGVIRVTCPTSL